MNRQQIIQTAKGIARYASSVGRKKGDKANYLGYQLPICGRLVMNKYNAFKMPRQTGKTWTASFIAVAYLLNGIDVLVAYPKLTQGWDILLSKIRDVCLMLGVGLEKASINGIVCSNGAAVHVVTTQKGFDSNRGYTAGCLLVDEAQNMEANLLNSLLSTVTVYARMDMETVIFMGTGGYRNKLLETCWRENDFQLTHLMPHHIISIDPSYKEVDDGWKKKLGVQGYRTEQLCFMVEGGNSSIFKHIDEPLPEHLREGATFRNVVGIDVGQNPDRTVVMWCKYYPGSIPRIEVVDSLRLGDPYPVQQVRIEEWIKERKLNNAPIAVEVNGIGRALYDYLSLQDLADPEPITRVGKFHIGADKRDIVYRLQTYDYKKAIHFTDEKTRNAVSGLISYTDDNGKWKCDHSDYLSALIAASTRIGRWVC